MIRLGMIGRFFLSVIILGLCLAFAVGIGFGELFLILPVVALTGLAVSLLS